MFALRLDPLHDELARRQEALRAQVAEALDVTGEGRDQALTDARAAVAAHARGVKASVGRLLTLLERHTKDLRRLQRHHVEIEGSLGSAGVLEATPPQMRAALLQALDAWCAFVLSCARKASVETTGAGRELLVLAYRTAHG